MQTQYFYAVKATDGLNQSSPYSNKVSVYATDGVLYTKQGYVPLPDEPPGFAAPSETKLNPSYPNPFNPSTTIRYQLSSPGVVAITVYNVLGESVAFLVHESKGIGYFESTWNSEDRPSGLYYVRMSVLGENEAYRGTTKIMLIK